MESPTERGLRQVRASLPEGVTLVAVTKGRSLGQIRTAIRLGCRVLGENRVAEAAEKIPEFADVKDLEWHMIGHLQRNKAKLACEIFDMIQSVDRWKLAEELEKRCALLGKKMPVLVEVNISRQERKHGVAPEGAEDLCQAVAGMPHLELRGLMAMAPLLPVEQTRPYFREMRQLFIKMREKNDWPSFSTLSMGMSNDYPVAIEEGSTMVRVGTAIFDPE